MANQKKTRREVADQLRNQQKRADKRQGLIIVGACVAIAVLIVGLAAFRPIKDWWDLRQYNDLEIGDIGAKADTCSPIITKKATGNQEHVGADVEVDYPEAPPAFGKHEDTWDPMGRKLYTKDDRPDTERLVHNLEHGYTILWFRNIERNSEEYDDLRAIADRLKGDSNMRTKFKAVEWDDADGEWLDGGNPWKDAEGNEIDTSDMKVAFTHWSKGGEDVDVSDVEKQVGAWQFCGTVSGAALNDFMIEYPYLDSPEPSGG
ncbi:DUF3105 domain-containing protein [Nocardioides dubius]|uniref:DUF3105 domain-containing protein n=1 Tax=Nocardioides dubius TaxID=317019 RepID=A0ABN1TLT1_9ACTN